MNNTPTKPLEWKIRQHGGFTIVEGPRIFGEVTVRLATEQEPPTAPPCALEVRVARLEAELLNRPRQDTPDAPQAILAQNTGIPQEWDEATKRAWHEWVTNPNGNSAMANLRLEFCKVIGEREELKAELRRVREVPAPFDMEKLWSELPSWINHIAMDSDGSWYGYSNKPSCRSTFWDGACGTLIPAEHAPPRASHLTASLTVRPGLEVAP